MDKPQEIVLDGTAEVDRLAEGVDGKPVYQITLEVPWMFGEWLEEWAKPGYVQDEELEYGVCMYARGEIPVKITVSHRPEWLEAVKETHAKIEAQAKEFHEAEDAYGKEQGWTDEDWEEVLDSANFDRYEKMYTEVTKRLGGERDCPEEALLSYRDELIKEKTDA